MERPGLTERRAPRAPRVRAAGAGVGPSQCKNTPSSACRRTPAAPRPGGSVARGGGRVANDGKRAVGRACHAGGTEACQRGSGSRTGGGTRGAEDSSAGSRQGQVPAQQAQASGSAHQAARTGAGRAWAVRTRRMASRRNIGSTGKTQQPHECYAGSPVGRDYFLPAAFLRKTLRLLRQFGTDGGKQAERQQQPGFHDR